MEDEFFPDGSAHGQYLTMSHSQILFYNGKDYVAGSDDAWRTRLTEDRILTKGSLQVSGTKSRRVTTDQYSDRLLYCYETPSPLFGDVGEGVIGEDGYCYVAIDAIFADTITTNQYQVFLQKYGQGDCWIAERKGGYFVVQGTPGLAFGWEMKAKQRDYDQLRLDNAEEPFSVPVQTYGDDAAQYIDGIRKARESA